MSKKKPTTPIPFDDAVKVFKKSYIDNDESGEGAAAMFDEYVHLLSKLYRKDKREVNRVLGNALFVWRNT